MYFVTRLPRTNGGFIAIWVIVDRLTKSAHLLPIRKTFTITQYADLYIIEIVRLDGIPVYIVSDRDPRFTYAFWKSLHQALGRKLLFNIDFHPQTDEQSERVSPMKGVTRFGKMGMLSPRFIKPFEILERVGTLAYRAALPPNLTGVHNVFHVSMLQKYMSNSSHVLNYEPLQLTPHLSFDERPTQKLDRQEKRLQNKLIWMIKVKWLNHSEERLLGIPKPR
ncbi:uncharacterized protein [Primulina eburnea]|uniref:uncharacterized protein n=1 Tax=Primulina eburnea TaxID=1245227 RepID=UPI003C6C129C